jgi:Fe-S-cluster formation regulator IscX/YfhJ
MNEPWNAQQQIAQTLAELAARPEDTPEYLAVRALERAFPLAVKRLISIAMHSPDDKVARLAALDIVNANVRLKELSEDGVGSLERLLEAISTDELTEARRRQAETDSKRDHPSSGG